MPTITVSTPIPFLGDPALFEVEPFIVVAGEPLKIEYETHTQSLRELYEQVLEKNSVFPKDLSPAQKKSVCFAAALRAKYEKASASFVSKCVRPILKREWWVLLPLVYASYTNSCVAAKKSEDPVIIYKRRFLKAKTEHLKIGPLKRAALATHVTDVISHAVGRLTVEAASALRRRDLVDLATILNSFSNLVFSLFEHNQDLLRLKALINNMLEKGYKGCAYIPTLEALVEI